MSEAQQNTEELTSKIAVYQQQLTQVEELLLLEPTNDQFLNLKQDLLTVISLTKDLMDQTVIESTVKSPNQNITKSGPTSSYDEYDDNNNTNNNDVMELRKRSGVITIGEAVEVRGNDRIYSGFVTGIINETEYKVKYFEFNTEVSLPLSSLTRIDMSTYHEYAIPKNDLLPGFKCLCKYATDQIWYPAAIKQVTAHGYVIEYTEYGNVEEVPYEYLKSVDSLEANQESKLNNNGGKKVEAKKWDGKSLIPIPENLKPLPTDTEEEKKRKKKKLNAIKAKNKEIQQELEGAAVQQNWQKFVSKGAKRTSGGVTKSSMFATTEVVEGKVGVVNSGKGMTTFADRKKHKFNL
eukprot:gene14084-18900_t